MPKKSTKPSKTLTVKNMSPKALAAAKMFKGFKAPRTPAKLRGKRVAEIARAVRRFYLG